MTLAILIPLAVMMVGILMYALATNPKVEKMGFALFVIGAAVATLVFARTWIHV